MYTVKKRATEVKQPRGGYLNKECFKIISIDDEKELNKIENVHPSLVGTVVDYLTRYMLATSDDDKMDAFYTAIKGGEFLDRFYKREVWKDAYNNAICLFASIKGLDEKSVTNACKLVGYDVCYRAGPSWYKPVESINPDMNTIENIVTMVNRSVELWKTYGPVIKSGFTFEGAYTKVVVVGEGDYLTKDTLWDLKVSKSEPTNVNTLQLLMYYIMGCNSVYPEFKQIERLGIFNPRLNKVYLANVSSIPREIIEQVSKEVIGYK